MLMNISGSTSNLRVFHAVRLVSITAYLPTSSVVWNGSVTLAIVPSISVSWASENAPQTTTSESNPGSIMQKAVFRPPKDSLAAFWSTSSANESVPILYLQLSTGVILDVIIQANMSGALQGGTAVSTTSSGTAGIIYNSYFDGPNSGAVIVPQGTSSLN